VPNFNVYNCVNESNVSATTYAGGADAIAKHIYNNTYSLPINDNDVVASVTDTSDNVTYYTDFAKAEKALREDYTLTLIKDYEGKFTPEFPVYVDKNGNAFGYSTSGTGYLADADGDVIHFREVTEADAAFRVGEGLYMTFAEAYAAAGAGDVITLIRDYEFEAGDFTADLTYTTLLTFPDNDNSSNSDALNSNTVTKGVVNGVNIDKEITLDLGGYNLSAQGLYGNTTDEGNGYGVLFYMAPTATHTFSIVGSGKISADMPLIHIAGGTVLVNGNTGTISLEYTDNERSISVRVGETIRSGSNSYNCSYKCYF